MFTRSAVFVITCIPGSSGLRRSFATTCLIIHANYAISLSLYPFTERYAQPYFFSCLVRQGRYIRGYKNIMKMKWAMMRRNNAMTGVGDENRLAITNVNR
nr:hypothetical protein [Tanacetum cinerariifolium]